ncbi:response regulator [Oceanospirillum beijerinckii]|uniref:response regulator n=1 Tax=Oceanospirillum beijerinckii TaxID=64976 RepID=UPI0003FF19FA|nr:response regulator [Oceanospirillum beijerinckii]
MTPWKILVVDDEEGIHGITRMIFRDYEFEQRPIELISAMNGAEAQAVLLQHPDIALILLDVVMETENEGLQLVEHIRHQMNNPDVRIILRTGHPGYAPEAQVIIQYDINDYLSKAELSASRLLTSVVVALRSYRDIQLARLQPVVESDEVQEEAPLLDSVAYQLQQQMAPILQQSQRLQQLDLNPVAKDLSTNLYAQQLRLNNSIQLLQDIYPLDLILSPVEPVKLMDEVLQIFLPQSRREGWLLDYRVDSALPQVVQLDAELMKTLLITSIELALLQAQGRDLKVSLQQGNSEQQLLIQVQQSSGQPVFDHSPWAQHLRSKLQQLCQQMQGDFLEIDESGVIQSSVHLIN